MSVCLPINNDFMDNYLKKLHTKMHIQMAAHVMHMWRSPARIPGDFSFQRIIQHPLSFKNS